MSVAGIAAASTNAASDTDFQAKMKKMREAMEQLQSALNSGDLDGAKKAYQTIQSLAPQDGKQKAQGNGVGDAFTALGDALDSGDLDAAKKAMAQIQSHRAHHGRHARKAADAESQTPVAATVVQDEAPSDGSLNVTA